MSKLFCFLAVVSVVLFANFNSTILANIPISHNSDVSEYGEVSDDVLEQRINNLNSQVDLRFTNEVKKYIYDYTVKYRHSAEDLIGRTTTYFPLIEETFRKKGIPDEIKSLAMVESKLSPNAVSPHGATGMWQFMKATARHYNLHQTSYVDERRDPEKSTEAAAAYLLDLYERFNDWTLAIAAYNCGPGKVSKAMKLAGKSDYWSIRKQLPKETQKYVPRLVAMHYLVTYYYAHNIVPDTPELNLTNVASAKVYNNISFKTISEQSGIDIELIEELNPQYVKKMIPGDEGKYDLDLPVNELFDLAYINESKLEIVHESVPVNQVFDLEDEIAARQVNINLLKEPKRTRKLVVKSQPKKKTKNKKPNRSVALLTEKKVDNKIIKGDFKRHQIKRMAR